MAKPTKESLLRSKREELADLVEAYDDHVRELFHLDTFVTLLGFDPDEARRDTTSVYRTFHEAFDLYQLEAAATAPVDPGRRLSRRSNAGQKALSSSPPPTARGAKRLSSPALPAADAKKPRRSGPAPARRRIRRVEGRGSAHDAYTSPDQLPFPPAFGGLDAFLGTYRYSVTSDDPIEFGAAHMSLATAQPVVHALEEAAGAPEVVVKPVPEQGKVKETDVTPAVTSRAGSRVVPRRATRGRAAEAAAEGSAEAAVPDATSSRSRNRSRGASETNTVSVTSDTPGTPLGAVLPHLAASIGMDTPPPHAGAFPPTELNRKELRDAKILTMADRVRQQGIVLLKPTKKPEMDEQRSPDHWQHLMEHAVHFQRLMFEEKRRHMSQAKRVSRMIKQHFKDKQNKNDKEAKELLRHQRALARWTAREVRKQWKVAFLYVKREFDELRKKENERLGKQQLHAMLDQSTVMLQAQKSHIMYESGSESSEEESGSSEEEGEEEEEEEGEEEEEEEEAGTGDSAENEEEAEDENAQNEATPKAQSTSPSPTREDIGSTITTDKDNEEGADVSETSDVDDGEAVFEESKEQLKEDEELLEQMDVDTEESDVELNGLEQDAEIPIEELMRRMGYAQPDVAVESNGPVVSEERRSRAKRGESGRVKRGERINGHSTPREREYMGDKETETKETSEASPPAEREVSPDDVMLDSDEEEKRDAEDQEMAEEMEAEASEGDSDEEIAGLAEDAELSVEELRRKYSGILEDGGEERRDDEGLNTGDDKEAASDSASDVEMGEASDLDQADQAGDEETEADGAKNVHSPEAPSEDVPDSPVDSDTGGKELTRATSPSQTTIHHVRPPFLLRGSLRPYQQAGLDWLASLYNNGVNGILADEMGLGKTIQTISLLAYLACEKGQWGPHLVVVPTSVMLNWEMEFKKFLPGFKILTYYGSQKERKEKRKGWNTQNAFHVCVTSYQLILADQHMFRRKPWHYLILDEAHHIKNFRSQRWQTLLGFNARHRLLLTGTPLQNNLMELWSLLYFLMPQGLTQDGKSPFADNVNFQAWFSNPMDRAVENGDAMDDETRETVAKLHTILRPYLLRRLKSEVEKQLPAKIESVIYCKMSKRQRFLYDEFMGRAATRESLASGQYMSIINCLMQLRKVCNHPDLFEVRPIRTSYVVSRSVASEYEVKDLLVRRRWLENEHVSTRIDWHTLALVHHPEREETASSIGAETARRLDAHVLIEEVGLGAETERSDIAAVGEMENQTAVSEMVNGTATPLHSVPATHSISAWRAHAARRNAQTQREHRRFLAYHNSRRIYESIPYFGWELLRSVRSVTQPRPGRHPLECGANAVQTAVAERCAAGRAEAVNFFGFATPNARALDLPRRCLQGLISEDALEGYEAAHPSPPVVHAAGTKLTIAFPDKSLLQYDCGKLQRLDTLLRECKAGGHRVLIFTQMTKVLDILEEFLSFHGHRYLRLDGSTRIEQRQYLTERFNHDDRILCFISSTRSGGLGINLQGADTVIFYDSDWNPALDKQCQDRAHRIGQTRQVRIWRFVTEHSIEQNMLKKANQKRKLDDMVISEGDFTTDYLQKVDWRDYFDGDVAPEAGPAAVEDNPPQGDIIKAMAAAEDEEDAQAAQAAESELKMDQSDFGESAGVGGATPASGGAGTPALAGATPTLSGATPTPAGATPTHGHRGATPLAEAVPEDALAGTIDGYMIRFIENNYELFV